ncbi:UNVERIFIED_CONTAM: hypothetical protein FKN15_020428 [Acipenser sinensis]
MHDYEEEKDAPNVKREENGLHVSKKSRTKRKHNKIKVLKVLPKDVLSKMKSAKQEGVHKPNIGVKEVLNCSGTERTDGRLNKGKILKEKKAKVEQDAAETVTSLPTKLPGSAKPLVGPALETVFEELGKIQNSKERAAKLFQWFISPISAKKFFSEIWEKKPALIRRHNPDYYKGLFSTAEFDRILRDKLPGSAKPLVGPALETVFEELGKIQNSKERAAKLFQWFISPISAKKFFSEIWEKKPALIRRHNPDYYKGLFSTAEFDRILRDNDVQYGVNLDVTSYSNGERETHNPPGRALPFNVWDFYKETNVVRVGYIGYTDTAERYLTPADTQGFAPHYDDIEAFVVQLEGKKHWRVYNPRTKEEVLPQVSSPLQIAIEEDVEFRQGLPLDYLSYMGVQNSEKDDPRRTDFTEKLQGLIKKLAKFAPVDAAVDQKAKDFLHDCLPPVLTEEEKATSVFGVPTRWEDGDARDVAVQINGKTKIRLLRKGVARTSKRLKQRSCQPCLPRGSDPANPHIPVAAERDVPVKPAAATAEILSCAAQLPPSKVMMPPMIKNEFFQWLKDFEDSKQDWPPQPVAPTTGPGTTTPMIAQEQYYPMDVPSLVYNDIIDSAPGDDTPEYTEGPSSLYINTEDVLRRISSSLNINTQTSTEENDFLRIIDAKDKKA